MTIKSEYPTRQIGDAEFSLGSVQIRQLRNIGMTRELNPCEALDYAINFARYWNKFLHTLSLHQRNNLEGFIREAASDKFLPPYSEERVEEPKEKVVKAEVVVE